MSATPVPQEPDHEHSAPRTPATGGGRTLRASHAALALLALTVLLLQFLATGTGPADPADPDPGVGVSVVRFFSYFTIASNLLVAASALLQALDRPMTLPLRVLRVDAITAIIITGVVHWFLLRPLNEDTGYLAVLDTCLHIVVPIAAVLVWLFAAFTAPRAGPRRLPLGVMIGSLLFPLAYAIWTFAHGAATGWYPYPFIDVIQLGYPRSLRMAALVLISFALVMVVLQVTELLVGRRRPTTPALEGPTA